MSTDRVVVSDTVRVTVKFKDIDSNGLEVELSPSTVSVTIKNSSGATIISTSATSATSSIYYYDYTPTIADTYTVKFTGVLSNGNTVVVEQKLYVSSVSEEYQPTIILKNDETITFAPDVDPLYLDPESVLAYFPDASMLEIGEIIYNYSTEVKAIYNLLDAEDGSNLSFTVLEYIKAATACELSRTYGLGGDDEMSLTLGDLSITNKSIPRNRVTRDNATTWCQIAAALRKEMLAAKVGPRGFQPKNLPGLSMYDSKLTDKIVYPSGRELYDPNGTTNINDDPMPKRGFRSYD
jgi:hypothetical protein